MLGLLDDGAGYHADTLQRLLTREGAGVGDIEAMLWELAAAGLVTTDSFAAVRARIDGGGAHRRRRPPPAARRLGSRRGTGLGSLGGVGSSAHAGAAAAAAASAARGVSAGVGGRSGALAGRWSLLPRPALDPTTRAVTAAELLLLRHGVVTRGAAVAEDVSGGFAAIYRVLARAEEVGRVRRGYLVEGLGAAQFAPPAAIDMLRTRDPDGPPGDAGRPGDAGGSGGAGGVGVGDGRGLPGRFETSAGRPGAARGAAGSDSAAPSAAGRGWAGSLSEAPGGARDDTLLLAATDPANPYGAALSWPTPGGAATADATAGRAATAGAVRAGAGAVRAGAAAAGATTAGATTAGVTPAGAATATAATAGATTAGATTAATIVGATASGAARAAGEGTPEGPVTDIGHRPGRKAGALVVLRDGELVLYLERGGRTVLTWSRDPDDLDAAARALASAVRRGAVGAWTVSRVDGQRLLGANHPLADALTAAGFHLTPQGLRLRR